MKNLTIMTITEIIKILSSNTNHFFDNYTEYTLILKLSKNAYNYLTPDWKIVFEHPMVVTKFMYQNRQLFMYLVLTRSKGYYVEKHYFETTELIKGKQYIGGVPRFSQDETFFEQMESFNAKKETKDIIKTNELFKESVNDVFQKTRMFIKIPTCKEFTEGKALSQTDNLISIE